MCFSFRYLFVLIYIFLSFSNWSCLKFVNLVNLFKDDLGLLDRFFCSTNVSSLISVSIFYGFFSCFYTSEIRIIVPLFSAINFPLSTTLSRFYKFWNEVFSFLFSFESLFSSIIIFSDLKHWEVCFNFLVLFITYIIITLVLLLLLSVNCIAVREYGLYDTKSLKFVETCFIVPRNFSTRCAR